MNTSWRPDPSACCMNSCTCSIACTNIGKCFKATLLCTVFTKELMCVFKNNFHINYILNEMIDFFSHLLNIFFIFYFIFFTINTTSQNGWWMTSSTTAQITEPLQHWKLATTNTFSDISSLRVTPKTTQSWYPLSARWFNLMAVINIR